MQDLHGAEVFGRRAGPHLVATAASLSERQVLRSALARLGSDLLEVETDGAGLVEVEAEGASFTDVRARIRVYWAAADRERQAAHRALASASKTAGHMDRWACHVRLADLDRAEGSAELIERVALEGAARVLAEARDRFEQLGACGWAARAAQQLERATASGPSAAEGGPALAPLEARTAMAAALGSGLADIAAGLYIDEVTAGDHLRRAMDKLGVSGPDELAALLPILARAASIASPSPGPTAVPEPVDAANGAGDRPLTIRLLGGFAITDGDERVELHDGITAQAVKAVALVAKIPAEELIELLWPETDPDLGRTRLRSLLARLRRTCRPVLTRQGAWITLSEDVVVDVDDFERHAGKTLAALSAGDDRAPESAREALELYGGELLPTDRHLDFTVGPRERLRRRYLALTEVVIEGHRGAGRLEEAVRLIEDAIATDPYDGQLYVRAASMLAAAGRSSEAASVIKRAEMALREIGLPLPSAAVELRRAL